MKGATVVASPGHTYPCSASTPTFGRGLSTWHACFYGKAMETDISRLSSVFLAPRLWMLFPWASLPLFPDFSSPLSIPHNGNIVLHLSAFSLLVSTSWYKNIILLEWRQVPREARAAVYLSFEKNVTPELSEQEINDTQVCQLQASASD